MIAATEETVQLLLLLLLRLWLLVCAMVFGLNSRTRYMSELPQGSLCSCSFVPVPQQAKSTLEPRTLTQKQTYSARYQMFYMRIIRSGAKFGIPAIFRNGNRRFECTQKPEPGCWNIQLSRGRSRKGKQKILPPFYGYRTVRI